MRITIPRCGTQQQPDPEDTFRTFNEEDLSPRARQELAWMRLQCNPEMPKPYPGQCDDCPGRSHPRCCWYTED